MTIYDEIAAAHAEHVAKGYTAEHDDYHVKGELAKGAAALIAGIYTLWPWPNGMKRYATRRKELLHGAAMAVAEIERLDRTPYVPRRPFRYPPRTAR